MKHKLTSVEFGVWKRDIGYAYASVCATFCLESCYTFPFCCVRGPSLSHTHTYALHPLSLSLSLQSEELDDKANAVLPAGLLARFEDPKWKERLEACEKLKEVQLCTN